MKRSVTLILLLTASSAMAHREDTPINTGSELRDWCKDESEAAFIGKGMTPYKGERLSGAAVVRVRRRFGWD